MPEQIPYLRIFLSSPGDVNEERKIAIEVIEALPYRPAFRDKVAFRVIAWDRPGADTPMLASLTPQEAINRGLPKPSECDITLVLFWKRMGTPFVDVDGTAYQSGTHWELMDALKSPQCETLIFHRTEKVLFDADDAASQDQYRKVKAFFSSEVFYKDGRILRGVNQYASPEEFRLKMQTFMEDVVLRILDRIKKKPLMPERPLPTISNIITIQREEWPADKSPFPGLRAFDETDAPIFFGRGVETSELVKRVEASRFVAVVAASGSGKSSLVAAGLIPRLKANAISSGQTGSKDWRFVRFTPGRSGSVLGALFAALCDAFPEHAVSAFMIAQEKRAFVESLTSNPKALIDICEALLKEARVPAWAELVFFIDQFEELFTLVSKDEQQVMVALLDMIQTAQRLRCVVTMRSDFIAAAIDNPTLALLINQGNYMLAAPTAGALVDMIKRPSERAGLTWDEGLPEQIQAETGSEPGSLALMAYALDELYIISHIRPDKRLTYDAYMAIGGVAGAIGKRAETTFTGLMLADKDYLLQRVFRELVTVNEHGTATRQRASQGRFGEQELELVRTLTDARLLVMDESQVEVAHEALFRSWERLKDWIAEVQEDLILLRQIRTAAHDWQVKGRPDYLLWPQERLTPVYAMQQRLSPILSEVERDFIEPEQTRLLREIDTLETDHKRRRWIGERLAAIGDIRSGIGLDKHGLPQIDWLPVTPGGEIKIEDKMFTVKPFYVARYMTTYQQFQAFLDAPDGFENERWWDDFPEEYMKQEMATAVAQYDNYPRDTVSWYQSVAFSRWLNAKYREFALFDLLPDLAPNSSPHSLSEERPEDERSSWQVRLPAEWEWQWMAQNGLEDRKYPWGEWDGMPRANITEAGIGNQSTAVGLYQHGAAVCGALDVTGNLWEWCLNNYENPEIVNGFINNRPKVLRGGSFRSTQSGAAVLVRDIYDPYNGYSNRGFRLVLAAPIASSHSGE
jgi:hypothetical protein